MNTRTDWLTTATIQDHHRRAIWGTIFREARVPIKSILPSTADLPGRPGAPVYMLDVEAISDEQREALIKMIHRLFGLDEDEVRRDLLERGVPILADGVTVETRDQGLVLSMLPDFDWSEEENET